MIGRSLVVNGQTLTVVGVAPRGFEGTTYGNHPMVFVPLVMTAKLGTWGRYEERRAYWLYLFGRLKPGVTIPQARSAFNGIYHPILNDIEAPLQTGMSDPAVASGLSLVLQRIAPARASRLMCSNTGTVTTAPA